MSVIESGLWGNCSSESRFFLVRKHLLEYLLIESADTIKLGCGKQRLFPFSLYIARIFDKQF